MANRMSDYLSYEAERLNMPNPPLVADRPLLDRIAVDIEELSEGVCAARGRAQSVADRLLGTRPEAPPAEALSKAPTEVGEVERLRIRLAKLRANLNAVHDQLQRLESL